jgi:NAD-dependent dihydropyrimidine dehydrogenase PreA subunit
MTELDNLTRFTGGGIAGRQAALPGPLRDLHRAVLRRFLETGAAPTRRWARQAALDTGLDASADPHDGAPVEVTVSGGTWSWTPAGAVAVAGRATDCGTECGSFEALCPHTVFHASRESAQAYLADRGDLDAEILDQDTAIECGRLNFGPLLAGPAR